MGACGPYAPGDKVSIIVGEEKIGRRRGKIVFAGGGKYLLEGRKNVQLSTMHGLIVAL